MIANVGTVSIDPFSASSQNALVRRLMRLAIGLFVLLWMADARAKSVPLDDVVPMSGGEFRVVAAGSDSPSDTGSQWRAPLHITGVVTESIWKFSLVHVELGATRSPRNVVTTFAASSPDPPAPSASHYLRRIPLLI